MSITETRAAMLAVVATVVSELAGVRGRVARDKCVAKCRKQIERIRKSFKRKIDLRARQRPREEGFAIHEREGIERKLEEVTEEAYTALQIAIAESR